MKEFRIAKCISEDGKGVGKHVIFKDGSRRKPILEDQEGREYIEIDNWINGDPDLLEFNYYPSMVKRMSLSTAIKMARWKIRAATIAAYESRVYSHFKVELL